MNIKKVVAAALILSSMTAVSASAAEFNDIKGHWAEDVINELADKDIIHGVSDTEFNPDGTVTRAEFLKMAMDSFGIVGHAYRDSECLDATNDDWYCYYLQGALDKNIIPKKMIENCNVTKVTKTLAEATDDKEAVTTDVNVYTGKFDGDKPITREEMAAIAVCCKNYVCKDEVGFLFKSHINQK